MFCHVCGKENQEGSAFCAYCGANLNNNQTQPVNQNQTYQNQTYQNQTYQNPNQNLNMNYGYMPNNMMRTTTNNNIENLYPNIFAYP